MKQMTASTKKMLIQLLSCVMLVLIAFGSVFLVKATQTDGDQTVENKSNLAYYVEGGEEVNTEYGYYPTILDDTQGLIANFYSASDKLVLRQVVDLYELNLEPIITFRPAPESTGTADFARVRMDLVDVYDPDIRVSYRTQNHPGNLNGEPASYTMVKSHVGSYKGYSHGVQSWSSDSYGTGANFPFYDGNIACISYYFDPVENMPYISSRWKSYVHYVPDGEKNWIVDLDDSSLHGSNVFEGFTTGEVYVEIWVEEFQGSRAHLFIEQYGDYDLSNTTLVDSEGPSVDVDLKGYEKDNLPTAVVGAKYPVFHAEAFDLYSGVEEIETKVYYNYYSTNKRQVNIRDDQTFIPTIAGNYAIEYTSYDNRNNKTVSVVDIKALGYSDVEGLSIALGEYQTETLVAELYQIPQIQIQGAIGESNVEIIARNNGALLEVVDGKVRPTRAGTLDIEIIATDFIGQSNSQKISATVNATDKPSFIVEPILPKYFIEGLSYYLPKIDAYNFIDGSGDAISSKISVEYGVTTQPIKDVYVPAVANNKDKVKVVYEASLNGKTQKYSKEIPVYKVKDGEVLDMTKYFDVVSGTVTPTYNSLVLGLSGGVGEYHFINSQRQTSFLLDFAATENTQDVISFTAVLTDYNNPEVSISLTYKRQGGGIVFYINGDTSKTYAVDANFNLNQNFSLVYDNLTREIAFDATKSSTILFEKDLAGEYFNGFTNNEYYVSFFVEGGDGADIAIKAINGSTLTGDIRDYIGPRISFVEDYGGEYQINQVYDLVPPIVYDVLDGNVDVYLTVETPAEKAMVSVQGKRLDEYLVKEGEHVSIKLNQHGTYFVNYYAEDSYGNKLNFGYTVNVVDTQKPKITLASKLPEEVEVGQKIHVPKATVTDNKDKNLDCNILIILPTGRVEQFYADVDMGFLANETGTITIIYSARDSEGNVENLVYKISVKEVA